MSYFERITSWAGKILRPAANFSTTDTAEGLQLQRLDCALPHPLYEPLRLPSVKLLIKSCNPIGITIERFKLSPTITADFGSYEPSCHNLSTAITALPLLLRPPVQSGLAELCRIPVTRLAAPEKNISVSVRKRLWARFKRSQNLETIGYFTKIPQDAIEKLMVDRPRKRIAFCYKSAKLQDGRFKMAVMLIVYSRKTKKILSATEPCMDL